MKLSDILTTLIALCWSLGLALVGLKLDGAVTLKWFWVMFPFWSPPLVMPAIGWAIVKMQDRRIDKEYRRSRYGFLGGGAILLALLLPGCPPVVTPPPQEGWYCETGGFYCPDWSDGCCAADCCTPTELWCSASGECEE